MTQMGLLWLLASAALHAGWHGAQAKPCGDTIMQQDFNGYDGDFQHWSEDRAGELFPGFIPQASSTMGRLEVGHGESKMEIQPGCVGARWVPSDGKPCGLLMQSQLDRPLSEATLTYKVKFSANYDWTAGGKLPGLCSNECLSGCKRDGNIGHAEGWSNRLMWREGGEIVSYTYYPDQIDCGVDLPWSEALVGGDWYELKLYIKLNDPGVSNGVQKAWVNGNLVWARSDMKYRNVGDHEISRFVWHTFHGGNPTSPSGYKFAPSQQQTIWFDDFLVQDGECAPGTAGPTQSSSHASSSSPDGSSSAQASATALGEYAETGATATSDESGSSASGFAVAGSDTPPTDGSRDRVFHPNHPNNGDEGNEGNEGDEGNEGNGGNGGHNGRRLSGIVA